VQLDPVKPTLKAPGTKRLKVKDDEPLPSSAFKVNLRRYSSEEEAEAEKNSQSVDYLLKRDAENRVIQACWCSLTPG
jgi:hypothetical protein